MFLASDDPADIVRLVEAYPQFRELYKEIAGFQQRLEELVNMYSEALAIMDRNTVKLMIEEQERLLAEQAKALAEQADALEKKDHALAEKDHALTKQADILAKQAKELEALRAELEALKR